MESMPADVVDELTPVSDALLRFAGREFRRTFSQPRVLQQQQRTCRAITPDIEITHTPVTSSTSRHSSKTVQLQNQDMIWLTTMFVERTPCVVQGEPLVLA